MARRTTNARTTQARRRGVVSVVSMMFLILFGSLAAAMAIMSRGNMITAATHQHVVRALGAAETGMAVSQQRLAEAAGRFVVNKGSVDAAFGQKLWSGPFTSSDGTVLAPVSYAGTQWSVSTMSDALMEIHNRDANTVVINNVASHNSEVRDGIIFTQAVALNDTADTAFQVQYELLPSGNQVRAMVTGYDFGYSSRGRPITRRIVQDFTLIKRVNAAIVSPSKVMIGKNVMVQGDLGAAYSDTGQQYGDPLVVKSDFWGLEPGLDAELTKLFNRSEENT